MQHSKEQIKELVIKLLKDIGRKYHSSEEINIQYEENLKVSISRLIIAKGWLVGVPVNDDRFHHPDGDSILIYINDETGEIVGYADGSSSRPIPMKAKKDSTGKYYLETV